MVLILFYTHTILRLTHALKSLLELQLQNRNRKRKNKINSITELLCTVLLNLSCVADRVYFAIVCHAWHSAARAADAPPRQLPWLLLPSLNASSSFSLHSGATRRLYLPEGVRGARFCGSHDGGWVAVAVDPFRGYAAVNLLSGARVPLPDRLRLNLPDRHDLQTTTTCEHRMVIRTVTFSAAPTSEGCLAAAHVSSASNIAFWRPGMDGHWLACRRDVDPLQDIIYHRNEVKQGFHVLTDKEDVLVYTPSGARDAPLEMSCSSYQVQKRVDYIPDQFLPTTFAVTRYLVESRGNLLMALRHYSARRVVGRRTRMFRIFEMKLEIAPHGGSEVSWVELHELPGRVLFLGRGCSRAFEVSQFSNLQEGSTYYLDDISFDISLVLNNGSKFSSTDLGMYKTLKIRDGVRRFPREFTSECSPPIWFVP